MGLFTGIFNKNKKFFLIDPVFGKIEFNGILWSHMPLNAGEDLMIVIDAPETGPSDIQSKFYMELKLRIYFLIDEARNFIKNQQKADFDTTQLNLYSIEINNHAETVSNNFVIELSDSMANEIHRVEFKKISLLLTKLMTKGMENGFKFQVQQF